MDSEGDVEKVCAAGLALFCGLGMEINKKVFVHVLAWGRPFEDLPAP